MSRLIIVSNRLPASLEASADGSYSLRQNVGGLATAIGPYHKAHRDCLWIGWSGIDPDQYTDEELEKIRQAYRDRRCIPIFLSDEEINGYYAGFSNNTLWPLFHDFSHEAQFNPDDWETYRKVNMRFAQVIEPLVLPGDTIWVQDYHLMLLPKMLRERYPKASIGWFLHVPFPSAEIFRSLPWCREILEGVLGADLVGFHTTDFVMSFLASIYRLLPELTVDQDGLVHMPDGHRAAVDAFPIGIDYNLYARTARSSLARAMRRGIEESAGKNTGHRYRSSVTAEGDAAAEAGDRDATWWSQHKLEDLPELTLARSAASSIGRKENKVIVSVDRLDYTKGLPERLKAFGRMLEKYPEWTGHVTYYLLATPSREDVESYRRLKSQVDELVGQINGRYSLLAWNPIHYITRSLSIKPICGIYAAGDVALVTPLRDGMNLVAKEYLACHDGREGALVLSDMCGAADELTDAFIVNPYDIDMVCEALHDALEISPDESRARNMRMQARLKVRTASNWCTSFLNILRQVTTSGMSDKRLRTGLRNEMVDSWQKASRRLILCDYDGTLTPLVRNPDRAKPTKALRRILRQVGSQPGVDLFLVSGRSHTTMEEWFADLPVGLIAEHGAWSKPIERSDSGPSQWRRAPGLPVAEQWQPMVEPIMEESVQRVPGSFIEVKSDALAWHYRKSDPKQAEAERDDLAARLSAAVAGKGLMVMRNSKVLEVSPVATSKGQAVLPWITSGDYDFVLSLGDDATDETMFAVMPDSAWSVKVGPGVTKARARLLDPAAVRYLLLDLAAGTASGAEPKTRTAGVPGSFARGES
ncbi:trehalose-phosphatase [Bifidobacterium actinocoloniiforme DSM 22766]|uniref:Trehalose-phosphatase n=1 Tax=Bifidobacterium actinocoloniiforme DSM 22766 TaxID=1437605 RepID=A0A086YWH3_9BIFI|nr:bifunctional alpha,alpha-trehalose-phosphate synthase (UDP-forming)/trehalose-phosphatase [Bifidobacterium actinocoloniiforme]KFI38623.1 trehalose-phosphatase [Bifidobacterium actinocoloniiforme DSM 22766]